MISTFIASVVLGAAYFGGSLGLMRLLGVEASVAVSTAMLIGATGWLEKMHVDRLARRLMRHHGQHDESCPHCGLTKLFMEWVERMEHEGAYLTRKPPPHPHQHHVHIRRVRVLNPPDRQSTTLRKS